MNLYMWSLISLFLVQMLIGSCLLVAWKVGRRERVAEILDSKWGPWLPLGLYWKLGREGSTLGEYSPLSLVFPALIPFRAGQRWTAEHGLSGRSAAQNGPGHWLAQSIDPRTPEYAMLRALLFALVALAVTVWAIIGPSGVGFFAAFCAGASLLWLRRWRSGGWGR